MNNLIGKRVLVTRPRAQSADFIAKITALGAVPVIFPTIEISMIEDTTLLDTAIANLATYQWIIFTSVNGVTAFFQRLKDLGKRTEVLAGIRIAAIGPATESALIEMGAHPCFVPEEHVAEAILPGLGDVTGQKILLPRAEIARKALVDALKKQGAFPDEVAIYRTLPTRPDSSSMTELQKGVDIATFTSSSTVNNLFDLFGENTREILKGAVIACIGPITAETARTRGLNVSIVAADYTIDGLIEALLENQQIPSGTIQ